MNYLDFFKWRGYDSSWYRNKHIAPKFFYTHELQKSSNIDVKQIQSCDNLVVMFTKPLPTATFKKMVHNIGMRRLKDIFTMNNVSSMYSWGRVNFLKNVFWLYSFSFAKVFFPLGFPLQDFNEAILRHYKLYKNIVLFFLSQNFFPQGFSLARF